MSAEEVFCTLKAYKDHEYTRLDETQLSLTGLGVFMAYFRFGRFSTRAAARVPAQVVGIPVYPLEPDQMNIVDYHLLDPDLRPFTDQEGIPIEYHAFMEAGYLGFHSQLTTPPNFGKLTPITGYIAPYDSPTIAHDEF